ncbi:MAG: C39 family peptidase [Nocardioidaceae bacterium]
MLAVRQYHENHHWQCGPASGKMILYYQDEGRSAYNNATQIQGHIGGPAHMQTNGDHSTQWDSHRFRIGLNRWREGRNTGSYVEVHDPSSRKFRHAVGYDVNSTMPFSADTVEFHDGHHYNDHPNKLKSIGHWVVIIGYYNDGYKVRFADPATSVWPIAPKFNYNVTHFAHWYLNDNGMVW